jgi:hypothetical protein
MYGKRNICFHMGPFGGSWNVYFYREELLKLISGPTQTVKTILFSFNCTECRVNIGVFIGYKALRKYFLMGLKISQYLGSLEIRSNFGPRLCEYETLASLSHAYLCYIFWNHRILSVHVWGQFGTLEKEEAFYQLALDFGSKRTLSKGIVSSLLCLLNLYEQLWLKMSVEHWWNNTERVNQQYNTKTNIVPFCTLQNPHGLN